MSNRPEFYIDQTLIKICEKKQININQLIKNTTQFLLLLNKTFDEDIENLLNNIIEEYKYANREELSLIYEKIQLKIAPEQKKIYQKISVKNRKSILNQIISIAINNSKYINCFTNERKIKELSVINRYSLDFFLLNEYLPEDNINVLEMILKKLKRMKSQNAIVKSFYTNLISEIFKAYKVDEKKLNYIDNYYVLDFIFEEFGKIYFVLNIKYKMSLKDKNKYQRDFKSKYTDLLSKYNNDIDLFIKNEINFAKNMSKENEFIEFMQFISALELYPLDITIFKNNEKYLELIDKITQNYTNIIIKDYPDGRYEIYGI